MSFYGIKLGYVPWASWLSFPWRAARLPWWGLPRWCDILRNRSFHPEIPEERKKLYYVTVITVRNSSCGKVLFSQVSVCPQGEVYAPQADIPSGRYHPPRQTHPQADTPQADTPWTDTPPGRHPLGRHPPGKTPPRADCTAADGMHPTGMHSCYCYRTWSIAVLSLMICTIAWASNFNQILESAKDCCKFYIVVWLHLSY